MVRTPPNLKKKVHSAIETVESDENYRPVASLWFDDRVNVGFGPADTSDGDNGLCCQIEVVTPEKYLDIDQLEEQRTEISDTGSYLRQVSAEVREIIENAIDREIEEDFVFIGLAPDFTGQTAVFDLELRAAE